MGILQNFLAFSEYMNFIIITHSTMRPRQLWNRIWFFNEFISCFHQFFSLIISMIFLSWSSWKRKQISCLSKTVFFFSFCQLKKIIITWKKTLRFRIRDWWNYLMNSLFAFTHQQFHEIFPVILEECVYIKYKNIS